MGASKSGVRCFKPKDRTGGVSPQAKTPGWQAVGFPFCKPFVSKPMTRITSPHSAIPGENTDHFEDRSTEVITREILGAKVLHQETVEKRWGSKGLEIAAILCEEEAGFYVVPTAATPCTNWAYKLSDGSVHYTRAVSEEQTETQANYAAHQMGMSVLAWWAVPDVVGEVAA